MIELEIKPINLAGAKWEEEDGIVDEGVEEGDEENLEEEAAEGEEEEELGEEEESGDNY